MAYASGNPKTKKLLKEWVAAGKKVNVYNPGPFPISSGKTVIEGPHFPRPHTWYASCEIDSNHDIIPGTIR